MERGNTGVNEGKVIFEGLIRRARSSARANRRTRQPPEFYEILIYQKTTSNRLPQTQSHDAVIPIISKAASYLQCSPQPKRPTTGARPATTPYDSSTGCLQTTMFKSSAALVLCCMAAANEENRNRKTNLKKSAEKHNHYHQHPLNPQRWSWRHVAFPAPSIKDQSVVASLLHHVCSCFASGLFSVFLPTTLY
ncbi:hypothetical protein BJX65DRAFT_87796 [Aspergillus insuetus]